MDKEGAVYLLKNRKMLLCGIQTTRVSLLKYIKEEKERDSILRQLSLPGASEEPHLGGKSYKESDTIFHIVDQYKEIRNRQIEEIRAELNRIAWSEECINQLFRCLYNMKEPHRSVLLMLYVENTKWEVVRSALGISNETLNKLRKQAFHILLSLYNRKEGEFEEKGEEVLFETIRQTKIERERQKKGESLEKTSENVNPLSIESLKIVLKNMKEVDGQLSLFGEEEEDGRKNK